MRRYQCLLAMMILGISSGIAFGQGGAAGGIIGRQGLTVTGEETVRAPFEAQPSGGQRAPQRTKKKTARASIEGRWRWKANCANGPGEGIFYLRVTSPGEFVGEFGNTNSWDRGTILNGKLRGNSLTFVSHYATYRTWTATLLGTQMRGSFTGSGGCEFSASKN